MAAAGGPEPARFPKSPQTRLHGSSPPPPPPPNLARSGSCFSGAHPRGPAAATPGHCLGRGQLHPNTCPGGLKIAGVLTVYPAATPKLSINACPAPRPFSRASYRQWDNLGLPSCFLYLGWSLFFFPPGPQFPRLYIGLRIGTTGLL